MNIYDFWQKRISKSYYVLKQILSKHLKVDDNDLILDYGCGTGKYCLFFKPTNYLGVDIDEKNVKIAKKNFKNYTFSQIKPDNLQFSNKKFDFILVVGVLHHISDNDLIPILENFNRIIKPDGRIMVIEPILSTTSTRINKWMKFVDRGKYIRYEKDLLNLFNKNFEVKELDQFITELFYNEKIFELTPKSKCGDKVE